MTATPKNRPIPSTYVEWLAKAREQTEDVVQAVRAAHGSPSEVGRRFGLRRSHVEAIRKRRIWRHVV